MDREVFLFFGILIAWFCIILLNKRIDLLKEELQALKDSQTTEHNAHQQTTRY